MILVETLTKKDHRALRACDPSLSAFLRVSSRATSVIPSVIIQEKGRNGKHASFFAFCSGFPASPFSERRLDFFAPRQYPTLIGNARERAYLRELASGAFAAFKPYGEQGG